MNLLYQIYSFTQLIWLFPPIKQHKSRYLIYFILIPPIEATAVIHHYFHVNFLLLQNLLSIISLLSILEKNFVKRVWPVLLLILLFFSGFFLSSINDELIFILIHSLILGIFIKQLTLRLFNSKVINLFILILVFYEITVVTKSFNLITEFTGAHFYYLITSIFEFFIGMYFCIFKEDSPNTTITLK